MALYKQFDKTFAKRLKGYVKEKANDFAVEISEDIAKAFVNQAKKRLLSGSTPRGAEDMAKVQEIADSIHYTKEGNICTVVVPNDPEGLNMFLEYGTGLAGDADKNPDAKKIGWKYAINKDKYQRRIGGYGGGAEKLGFIFTKKGTYLDENDLNPVYTKHPQPIRSATKEAKIITVKGYTDSRGRTVESYVKQIDTLPKAYKPLRNKVLSQGIKPVRYIYATRVNLNRIIGQFKNKPKGYMGLRRKLKELQK